MPANSKQPEVLKTGNINALKQWEDQLKAGLFVSISA